MSSHLWLRVSAFVAAAATLVVWILAETILRPLTEPNILDALCGTFFIGFVALGVVLGRVRGRSKA